VLELPAESPKRRKVVRIVAVADTHMFHGDLVIPNGDIFIHAGDMCRRGLLSELQITSEWVAKLPHRHKIIVSGNHDWPFQIQPQEARGLFPHCVYLQDSDVTVAGLRVWGSPWQPEFCDWAFNLPRGPALANKWALIPTPLDILITHGPPRGVGDQAGPYNHVGCLDLRRRVNVVHPRLHLFGHIHEDHGHWYDDRTVFANVTTNEARIPATVIDYHPASGAFLVKP